MKRKYLDDLGVTERPDLWNPEDSRQQEWAKFREEYSFDERETWALDLTFHLWLYERVMMYKECAPVDLTFNKFNYKGEEYTQEQMIDMLLERLKFSFTKEYNNFDEEQFNYVREIEYIWAELCPAMWW